ncbi:MAG: DUF3341 domain-containing protein [Deltaproteobacteria bacterium]|nr:DUF3341 domain-containing protein [Deltaproteobacteria bacterium]
MSARLFVAWFEEEDDIRAATTAAREAGFNIYDIYTPYAVHGLDEAMGLRPSRLTAVCLGFALVGLGFALGFQYWASVVSWPLNVGGKPLNSLPAFIPVTFELTVLLAGLGTVAALLVRAGLYPRRPQRFVPERVTNDRFALALAADGRFDETGARGLCRRAGAVETAFAEAC